MASKNHTHKYHKIQTGVWACALPDCTHFMPLNVADQVEGKKSICWTCGDEMILDSNNMEDNKPECLSCNGVEVTELTDFLNQKLSE